MNSENRFFAGRRSVLVLLPVVLLSACSSPPKPAEKLTVAAAANLTDVFDQVGRAFTAKTGVQVVFSYGSTAQLAQQIDNGAPFDLFAAADVEHVDSLIVKSKLTAGSKAVYATGQLALWIPKGEASGVKELKDLAGKQVRFVGIAQPELAPYGQATVDALKSARLWDAVQSKVVYSPSISQVKVLASSGNADAVFTAFSLVLHESGTVLKIDPKLYKPLEQAMAIVTASPRTEQANQFRSFLLGDEGRTILSNSGYLLPKER